MSLKWYWLAVGFTVVSGLYVEGHFWPVFCGLYAVIAVGEGICEVIKETKNAPDKVHQ